MKPFQYIKLQIAFQDDVNKHVNTFVTWKKVIMPDGTKLYFSQALMNHENRQSKGI